MLIMAFVLACGLATLALCLIVLRKGDPAGEVEPPPFRFEDAYEQVPEIRAARQRAMAVPRKYPALRTRNSR